jgi:hypothetical protein
MADNGDLDFGDLIARLRAESAGVRDCFTQFSFNSIALCSAALGAILSASALEYADLAAIPFVGLLIVVCRIGIYKYATSNRLLGYELHLFRSSGQNFGGDGWQPHMRDIDWEAALRSWRVVQPALFRAIYKTPEDFPKSKFWRSLLRRTPGLHTLHERFPSMYHVRKEIKNRIDRYEPSSSSRPASYPWFHLPTITKTVGLPSLHSSETGLYHAGSYLRHMLSGLFFLQFLLLFPMALEIKKNIIAQNWASQPSLLRLSLFLISLIVIMVSKLNARRRRELIESEILSIHSCAIIWQAVVLAHFRAVKLSPNYSHYTEELAKQATEIAREPFSIHVYIRTGSVSTSDQILPNPAAQADSSAAA